MANITTDIKQAIYEGAQQIIKPLYKELDDRSVLGKELQYGEFSIYYSEETKIATDTVIPLVKQYGNIEMDTSTYHIKLSPYKKYRISCIPTGTASGDPIQLRLFDEKGNLLLGINSMYLNCSQTSMIYETLTESKEIYLKTLKDIATWGIRVIVEEISRQIIIDPAEEAKKKEIYYKEYKLSDSVSLPKKTDVTLELTEMNTENKVTEITLEKGKRYLINANVLSVGIDSDLYYTFYLYLYGNDTILDSFGVPYYNNSSNQGYNIGGPAIINKIIEPNEDMKIKFVANGSGNMRTSSSKIIIQELPHPYYFNNYKDSLSSKVLFEGETNAVGNYSLLDSINNYEWVDVICSLSITTTSNIHSNKQTIRIYPKNVKYVDAEFTYNVSLVSDTRRILFGFKDATTLKIDRIESTASNIIARIEEIIGYGFNYENPYRDIQKEIDVDNLSEDTLKALKAKLDSITI